MDAGAGRRDREDRRDREAHRARHRDGRRIHRGCHQDYRRGGVLRRRRDSRRRRNGKAEHRGVRHQGAVGSACHSAREAGRGAVGSACHRASEEAWAVQFQPQAPSARERRVRVRVVSGREQQLLDARALVRERPVRERVRTQASVDASAWSTPCGSELVPAPVRGPVQGRVQERGSVQEPGWVRGRPGWVRGRPRVQAALQQRRVPVSVRPASASALAWARALRPPARARVRALARLRESDPLARPCGADDRPVARQCWRSDSSPRCREHRKGRGSPDWTSPVLLRAHRHGLLLARMTHPRGFGGRTRVISRSAGKADPDAMSDRAGTSRDDASGDCEPVLRRHKARSDASELASAPGPPVVEMHGRMRATLPLPRGSSRACLSRAKPRGRRGRHRC